VTDKWQCSKCKQTAQVTVRTITDEAGRAFIDPQDIPNVKCCFRVMRNLTDAQYANESALNDSGARG
jgi:serine/threonine protein kinase HipA of HipAB toxin-antitoxin module